MSMFGRRTQRIATIDGPVIPSRTGLKTGSVSVTQETALRHSAVWACLALRAGLISTFPVDVFRDVAKIAVEMPKPPIFKAPGGEDWEWEDWAYASQFDLDRAGNTIGLITEVNALGLPARIDLQAISECSVVKRKDDPVPKYRIGGTLYDRSKVWHERQYVVAGLPVGLSPLAYAAWTIGEYLSIQQFALDWFAGAAVPKAQLRNIDKKLVDPKESGQIRDRWRATIADGDLFVTGSSWEFKMMQAQQAGMEWLEGKRYGLTEICRYHRCPADLIDAAISAPGTLTYASISQRNLQFLIMYLAPDLIRREKRWSSKLLPAPRYVKLNTDALLRLDPETMAKVLDQRIKSKTATVSEARAFYNLPPLTPDQEEEFVRLFGGPKTTPTAAKTALAAEPQTLHAELLPMPPALAWAQPRALTASEVTQ